MRSSFQLCHLQRRNTTLLDQLRKRMGPGGIFLRLYHTHDPRRGSLRENWLQVCPRYQFAAHVNARPRHARRRLPRALVHVWPEGSSRTGLWGHLSLTAPHCQEVEFGVGAVNVYHHLLRGGHIWHNCHLSHWRSHHQGLGMGGNVFPSILGKLIIRANFGVIRGLTAYHDPKMCMEGYY